MRNCPVCTIALKETGLARERIDRCEKCGGLFFDKGELASIIDMKEVFDEVELPEEDIATVPKQEYAREVLCPADGTPMEPEQMADSIVDICPSCGGTWLDGGELSAIKLAQNNILTNLKLYIRLGK